MMMPDTVLPEGKPALRVRRARRGTERRLREPQVGVRLSPSEFEQIAVLAAAAGLSRPDFMRRAALRSRTCVRRAAKEPVAEALRQVAGQLALLGRNVSEVNGRLNGAACMDSELSAGPVPWTEVVAVLDRLRDDVHRALGVTSVLGEHGQQR